MTAITLGYQAHGRAAEPIALYVGNDAGAARATFENPPEGIVRTELILHPIITRRRVIGSAPDVAETTPTPEPAPEAKPAKAKPEPAEKLPLPSKSRIASENPES